MRKRCAGFALELFPHIDGAVPLLDAPAGDRVQRRRAQGLAGAQAETGMVPRTANRIVDQQPFGERRAIMRADGADREQLVAAPGEQHRFAVRVPEQHGAVGNRRERDALREIGSAEFRLCFAHSILPDMLGLRYLRSLSFPSCLIRLVRDENTFCCNASQQVVPGLIERLGALALEMQRQASHR